MDWKKICRVSNPRGRIITYDSAIHHKRSIRLPGYDYSAPGAYFIAIATHRRLHVFGRIVDGEMHLNEWGKIARAEWMKTAAIRREIALDEFIHGECFLPPPLRQNLPHGPRRRKRQRQSGDEIRQVVLFD
jgi:hypothetical protein